MTAAALHIVQSSGMWRDESRLLKCKVLEDHLTVAIDDHIWLVRLHRHQELGLLRRLQNLLVRKQLAEEAAPQLSLDIAVLQKSAALRVCNDVVPAVEPSFRAVCHRPIAE